MASVAVLLLVAVMLVSIFWQATHPKPLADMENEPPPGADRAQEGLMQVAPNAQPGR